MSDHLVSRGRASAALRRHSLVGPGQSHPASFSLRSAWRPAVAVSTGVRQGRSWQTIIEIEGVVAIGVDM
jgi:hypothetical protein